MKRYANVNWKGPLTSGSGRIESTQSGALGDIPISFKARFEDETGRSGTNPEELIAAAHASCFSMALSHALAQNGTPAESLEAKAEVELQPKQGGGFEIRGSALSVTAKVPGLEDGKFQEIAKGAKENCPVSRALGAISITLDAKLG